MGAPALWARKWREKSPPAAYVAAERCKSEAWDTWNVLTIDPEVTELEEPLDVDPTRIRSALKRGCVEAASTVYESEGWINLNPKVRRERRWSTAGGSPGRELVRSAR